MTSKVIFTEATKLAISAKADYIGSEFNPPAMEMAELVLDRLEQPAAAEISALIAKHGYSAVQRAAAQFCRW